MRKKLFWGSAFAFLLFLSLAAYVSLSNRRTFQSTQWIAHTQEVLFHIEELLRSMVDVETGQRGFTITQQDIFLEPLLQSRSNIDKHLSDLRTLVSDNPVQLHNIDTLQDLILKKMEFAEKAVSLSQQNRFEEVRALMLSMEGKHYMDEIRFRINTMKDLEEMLLQSRLKKTNEHYAHFQILFFTLIFLSSGILFAMTFLVQRSNVQLNRALNEIDILYNRAPCGYHSVDEHGRLLDVNLKELDWLGYSKAELIGREVREILIPADESLYQEDISTFMEQGWVVGLEYELLCKDGSRFPVIINSIAIRDEHGKFLQVRTCLFDNRRAAYSKIEILKLNRELQNTIEGLEEANKQLESFSYSVSHDLRGPIRSISGYTNILQEDYGSVLDQEGLRILQVICRNTKKMNQLIDDLLALSQLGKKELMMVDADMERIARKALAEGMEGVKDKEKVRIEFSSMGRAFVDLTLMEQVWVNLISNALKFSRTRTVQEIKIGRKNVNGLDAFYVEDNGVGFDMTYAYKLFGVFQRLHKQSEFEGTGVGLAIVHRIIQRHHGKIWAHSHEGNGAGFYFTVPNPEDYEKQYS